MTAAARQRAYRARQRSHRVVLAVEVDAWALAEAALDLSLLSPMESEDRDRLADVAAAVLGVFEETVTRNAKRAAGTGIMAPKVTIDVEAIRRCLTT